MARVVERITVEWVEPEAAGGCTPTPGAGSGGGRGRGVRGGGRGTVWAQVGGGTAGRAGGGGDCMRGVKERGGVGGVHDAGSPALSDSGPDRGADLQPL